MRVYLKWDQLPRRAQDAAVAVCGDKASEYFAKMDEAVEIRTTATSVNERNVGKKRE